MNAIVAPSSKLRTSGEVLEWPLGFAEALPGDYWHVAHARPRQEKLLAFDLKRRGIAGLLFLENRTRVYEKSTQTFKVPLLGGYVFVHVPRERRDEVYDTGRIARLIDVADPERLRNDLDALRRLIAATEEGQLIVRPELIPGKLVWITSGIFSGCQGVIHRRKDNAELVVNLPLLGRSVATRIPLALAELADA